MDWDYLCLLPFYLGMRFFCTVRAVCEFGLIYEFLHIFLEQLDFELQPRQRHEDWQVHVLIGLYGARRFRNLFKRLYLLLFCCRQFLLTFSLLKIVYQHFNAPLFLLWQLCVSFTPRFLALNSRSNRICSVCFSANSTHGIPCQSDYHRQS